MGMYAQKKYCGKKEKNKTKKPEERSSIITIKAAVSSKLETSQVWWLTTVILAIWESDFGRIVVGG
jgi:hypothetical protein